MHNFLSLTTKDNNFRKGVYLDSFDEPTYLTFSLDFRFEDAPIPGQLSELELSNSPLFNEETAGDSAMGYLNGRGYPAQADGLATFKGILKHLTFNAPWYFQGIEGLHKLYKQNTDQSKGFKTKDAEIEINTLEAVDLRIAELAGLYRNAIYDNKHRRERVPDNLRWFSVDIYVAEFRNLRYRIPGEGQTIANTLGVDTGAIGNIVGGGNLVSNVMDQYGFIKFKCRQCEFDFSDSMSGQSKMTVGGDREMETSKFKIKVGWVEEEAKYGDGTRVYEDPMRTNIKNPWGLRKMATGIENAGSFLSNLPVIGDPIKEAGQKVQEGLAKVGGFINPTLQAASRFIDPPIEVIGDRYNTGYASNGDNVPPKSPPTTQNAYDI